MAGEVTYQPTKTDYVAAHRDWFTRLIRSRARSTLASAALSAAATLAVLRFLAGDRLPVVLLVFGAGLLVGPAVLFFWWGLIYALLPRRAGRLFDQHRSLRKEVSYGWSDEGLSYRGANGSGRIAWEDLHRWAAGRYSFLFYLNDNLFHFVPRRVLSDAEATDLCSQAAGRVPKGP